MEPMSALPIEDKAAMALAVVPQDGIEFIRLGEVGMPAIRSVAERWHALLTNEGEIDLDVLFEPPMNHFIAGGLLGTAGLFFTLCIRRFILAYRRSESLSSAQWFVRAIRCLIIALTAAAWAAGIYWNQTWLLIIGLVIICQELYEGAILGAALRTGRQIEKGETPFG